MDKSITWITGVILPTYLREDRKNGQPRFASRTLHMKEIKGSLVVRYMSHVLTFNFDHRIQEETRSPCTMLPRTRNYSPDTREKAKPEKNGPCSAHWQKSQIVHQLTRPNVLFWVPIKLRVLPWVENFAAIFLFFLLILFFIFYQMIDVNWGDPTPQTGFSPDFLPRVGD